MIDRYAGREMEIQDETYKVLTEDDIIGVINTAPPSE